MWVTKRSYSVGNEAYNYLGNFIEFMVIISQEKICWQLGCKQSASKDYVVLRLVMWLKNYESLPIIQSAKSNRVNNPTTLHQKPVFRAL